jgi:hypothetical protein
MHLAVPSPEQSPSDGNETAVLLICGVRKLRKYSASCKISLADGWLSFGELDLICDTYNTRSIERAAEDSPVKCLSLGAVSQRERKYGDVVLLGIFLFVSAHKMHVS